MALPLFAKEAQASRGSLFDLPRRLLGLNAWVTGDISQLELDNCHGHPSDPATLPHALFAGLDYRIDRTLIVGGVIPAGTQRPNFSTVGNFTQDDGVGRGG